MTDAAPAGGARPDRAATVFVAAVWALLAAGALAFVAVYDTDLPWWDSFEYVPAIAGMESPGPGWLLDPHMEHRLPLPKIAFYVVTRAAGGDFRAGSFFSAALLAVMAAGLVLAARRLRGRTVFADAFFPLACLHGGHWEAFTWSFQVQFACSLALLAVVLALMLRDRDGPATEGRAWGVTACLLLLPLCGGNGVLPVPPLAAWAAAAGIAVRRRGGPGADRRGAILVGGALFSTALCIILAWYYRSPFPRTPGFGASGAVAIQFLSKVLGPGAQDVRDGVQAIPSIVALALLLGTAILCVRAARPGQGDRLRAAGLLAFLAGMVLVAAGIGWTRASQGARIGLSERYTTLALPLAWWAFFAWEVLGSPAAARLARPILLLAMAAVAVHGQIAGMESAAVRRARMGEAYRALRQGTPIAEVAKRNEGFLHPIASELQRRLEWMRDAGLGPWRNLPAGR